MLTKIDLEKLAEIRLEDAILLLREGRASSAYYLAGYALEFALKACISKQMQSAVIPDKNFIKDIYTHNLGTLLGLAGLNTQFTADSKINPKLAANWAKVTQWNGESRYEFWDPLSAAGLLEAISDPNNGVFQWVKKHW